MPFEWCELRTDVSAYGTLRIPRRQPIFLTRLRRIAANSAVPASVLATTLAMAGTSSAQVESVPQTEIRAEQVATGERPSTEPSAAISGYVLDPNGAAVPFALVSITNEALYDYRITNADAEGHYEFTSLPAGTYKLRAEAPGFEPIELGSLALGKVRAAAETLSWAFSKRRRSLRSRVAHPGPQLSLP